MKNAYPTVYGHLSTFHISSVYVGSIKQPPEKKNEKKYFVGMYSKCVFVLKQGYSSHLNKEKNCLFCPTCFCTLLDCFSGSVIFFDLEKFYNTKLKSSTERFNQIVRNSQPHLLYSPSWVPLCMDLDPLTMSITNKPFFLSVNC